MVFRPRWTEEQFDEWFQARFKQWINDRLDAELNQRLKAWINGHFQERFTARFATHFDARFDERLKSWIETELKAEFDGRIDHWFDLRFEVWANTWAERDALRQRLDEHFDTRAQQLFQRFQEQLDELIKARVANEIHTLIDRRIEEWLVKVRKDLLEAASPAPAQPSDELPAEPSSPAAAKTVATPHELAQFLAKGPLQPQQIRRLLKGKEISGRSPIVYPLGEAASILLTRRGRKPQAPDESGQHRDTTGS